jgi:aminoglycoside phosphotransferase (APT) family kinase protein
MITESELVEALIAPRLLSPQIYRPAGSPPNRRHQAWTLSPLVDRAVIDALSRLAATRNLRADDVVPMTAKGVNHDHYRLGRTGLVLRVPRATPWAGDAEAQLTSEAAAFERAEPAGVTPRLIAALSPAPTLPRGALAVEEIVGRLVQLPTDLPAIARTLAKLHSLPVPPPERRAPLPDHGVEGPVAATLAVIAQQREFLPQVDLARETRAALEEEYAEAERLAARVKSAEQPLSLVGTDTHPGNFIIRPDGRAALVDLERICYGSPAIDLAHATLYTSTTWDLEVRAALSPGDVAAFYRDYLALVEPERAAALRPWLLPARRLTWLRTMIWAVRLRALMTGGRLALNEHLARHIQARLDEFFDPGVVACVRTEWHRPTEVW